MAAAHAADGRTTEFGQETDARQVFRRLAGCWTYWGWKGGYFSTEADARAFYDETCYMLAGADGRAELARSGSTPACTGPTASKGPPQGHYCVDPSNGASDALDLGLRAPGPARLLHPVGHRRSRQRRRHHGPVGPRGPHLQVRLRHRLELLRISAARANRSPAAASRSGLMSFLKIGDRAAGAIKSGGTTRRAAKMVVLDLDHPDIEEFINWKVVEEQKVAALVTGSKLLNRHLNAILKACHTLARTRTSSFDREQERRPAQGDPSKPAPRWSRRTTSSA